MMKDRRLLTALLTALVVMLALLAWGCGDAAETGREPAQGDVGSSGTTTTTIAPTTTTGFPPTSTDSSSPASTAPPAPAFRLPDLTPLPPQQLYIDTNAGTGERELRFSSQVANRGDAPLEMRGERDGSGRTLAIQRLETAAGGVHERVVGFFILHEEHNHWHFEDFTRLDILALEASGAAGRVMASTEKLTSCVRDRVRLSPTVAGSPEEPGYRRCRTDIQGISVGWTDLYEADLPGQLVNIDELPDGRYLLRLTADPDNRILEKNEDNNVTTVTIEIRGRDVSVAGVS
jgi:hypothetical protein